MTLHVSPGTARKLLQKHQVSVEEIEQCFSNRTHGFLIDKRSEHQTDPITQWFIAEGHCSRKLKVCFMFFEKQKQITIKTAYEPSATELEIYYKYAPLL